MGRVKLRIKRLESTSNRQVTYSKRRNGILKKARELSILCDIDIVLLMFSPTGRPTLFHGERSNIEEVIAKFGQLTPQERAKRKLESLEALKKTFKKLDHDVNIQDFLGASNQNVEELTYQARFLQAQVTEIHKRLSYWSNPEKVDKIELLRQMEDSIRESIDRIRQHKENIGKHQLMSLECTGQFQNEVSLPLMMGGVQAAQPLSWLSNNDNQHLILLNEPNFLPPRWHFAQEGGGLNELSISGGALTELSSSGSLNLQLGEQYSYPPYSTNIPEDKKSKPAMEMNLQGNPGIYEVNSNFELPRPTYDSGQHSWVSASGHCGIAMFDKNLYHQQPN